MIAEPGGRQVTVLYFAAVRELIGRDEEVLDLPHEVDSVRAFVVFLTHRYRQLQPVLSQVRFARNEVFATLDDVVCAGDVIAVIPPVAGGSR